MNKSITRGHGNKPPKFDVQDVSLIRRNTKRWPGMNTEVQDAVLKVVRKGLDSDDPKISQNAAKIAVSIDRLNLEDEKINTPNVNIDIVVMMSDKELEEHIEAQLAKLNGRVNGN